MGAGTGNEFGHFENLTLLRLVNAFNRRECNEQEALRIFRENFQEYIDSPSIHFFKNPDAIFFAEKLLQANLVSQVICPVRNAPEIKNSLRSRFEKQIELGVFRYGRLKKLRPIKKLLSLLHVVRHQPKLNRALQLVKKLERRNEAVVIIDFSESSTMRLKPTELFKANLGLSSNVAIETVWSE